MRHTRAHRPSSALQPPLPQAWMGRFAGDVSCMTALKPKCEAAGVAPSGQCLLTRAKRKKHSAYCRMAYCRPPHACDQSLGSRQPFCTRPCRAVHVVVHSGQGLGFLHVSLGAACGQSLNKPQEPPSLPFHPPWPLRPESRVSCTSSAARSRPVSSRDGPAAPHSSRSRGARRELTCPTQPPNIKRTSG